MVGVTPKTLAWGLLIESPKKYDGRPPPFMCRESGKSHGKRHNFLYRCDNIARPGNTT